MEYVSDQDSLRPHPTLRKRTCSAEAAKEAVMNVCCVVLILKRAL